MNKLDSDYDVLIVGGGPAGLAAGIVLAEAGISTLLCERKKLPVDKFCGEGLMPTGVTYLQQLGVQKFLPTHSFFSFKGIRYHSPRGVIAEVEFAEGPGLGIRRTALSQALLQRAQELDFLDIAQETKIQTIEYGKEGVILRTKDRSFKTRLLIGADGHNSLVRHWAGLKGSPAPSKRWGAGLHLAMPPWSSFVEVHWGQGIEAYVTPTSEEQVGIVFLWDRNSNLPIAKGNQRLSSLFQFFPYLQQRLDGELTQLSYRMLGPLCRQVTSVTADGILLIGDAAGFLDALTGEGVSVALAEALSLKESLIPSLRQQSRGIITKESLQAYETSYHQITQDYFRFAKRALILSQHPWLVEGVIRLFRRDPLLFQEMISSGMGRHHSLGEHIGQVARLLKTFLPQPEN